MRTYSEVVWDLETLEIVRRTVVHEDYGGPVERACGASKEQKIAFGNIQAISGLMKMSFQKIFSDNQAILKNITDALTPIVRAGASQFAFSPAEEAARRTEATAKVAAAGKQAADVTRQAIAARGGGNIYLPSGSEAAIEAGLARDIAVKQAEEQLGITEKGYETGRQQFFTAAGQLAAAPGQLEAPITAAGGAAIGAGSEELKAGEAITAAKQAYLAPLGGIIGGTLGLAKPG